MKEIHCNDIAQAVARLAIDACYRLPADMVEAMRKAREAEPSPVGRTILDQLLENAGIAADGQIPLC
jgi:fumarate hydratase subunit alpha